nr:J domain-containing protein [Candidatus Gracilibacteria bacterium]
MSSKDFYAILGLERTCSSDEIKKAYRKLAMQYHPDRNGGDKEAESKFKEINEAYSILSDEGKRKQYDMFGSVGGGNGFGGGGFGGGVDFDISDIFDSFFSGGGGFSQSRTRKKQTSFRGEDLEYNLKINLETSIYGGKQKIKFSRMEGCPDCNSEGGSGKKPCPECNGSGYVKYRQQSIFGVIEHTGVCETCEGTGETFDKLCETCKGKKRVKKDVDYDIDIPAGIDDGMIIKITGEGNHGINTKANGDLYVKFKVDLEEKGLKRDGEDLYFDLELDVVEAILGCDKEVQIPILGKRLVKISAGTQVGTVIKIAGDGVKHINKDAKGDLFFSIEIKIPKKLSKEEKDLYEQIAKERKLNVGSKGIFDKLF